MTTPTTLSVESGVKSAAILAALTANPALIADALGIKQGTYTFAVTASYILLPKDIDYASAKAILNGPTHFIVYINDTALKAGQVKPSIVGYVADDGIFCAAYSQILTSSTTETVAATTDDAATASTETASTETASDSSSESSTETASAESESSTS